MNTEHDTPSSAPGHGASTSSESTHSAPQPSERDHTTARANTDQAPRPGATPGTPPPDATAPAPETHDRATLATITPTPAQVRAARTLAQHSQDEAAQLVHVTGRAWRRWESGEREISGAAWELYLIKALGFSPIK